MHADLQFSKSTLCQAEPGLVLGASRGIQGLQPGPALPLPQYTVHQLLPSLGISPPVISRIRSTNHQMPRPPRVSSLPTAVPVWPRQNRSTPKQPRKKE